MGQLSLSSLLNLSSPHSVIFLLLLFLSQVMSPGLLLSSHPLLTMASMSIVSVFDATLVSFQSVV